MRLTPQDTSLNLDTINYSTASSLTTYTWPDRKAANAIVMKFDLSSLPAAAVVQAARLRLALVESDAKPDATYTITAHKIVQKNPVIAATTGYNSDSATQWTPNACCASGVPLAQADVSPAYDAQAIDKTAGYKTWTITALVREWASSPSTNFGVLLNSDASKLADAYRTFASMEHGDPNLRPYLEVTYTGAPADTTPPTLSAVAASSISTAAATITWTTNEISDTQVEYGPTTAYGSTTTLNLNLVTAHTG